MQKSWIPTSKGLVQLGPNLYSVWGFLTSKCNEIRQVKFSANAWFGIFWKIWAHLNNFYVLHFIGGPKWKNQNTSWNLPKPYIDFRGFSFVWSTLWIDENKSCLNELKFCEVLENSSHHNTFFYELICVPQGSPQKPGRTSIQEKITDFIWL